MTRRLPMFPLGRPLLPGVGLPLQVFEPRYLAMMDDVLDEESDEPGHFGVVLITRGHEVGGGDLRSDVGTDARVVSHEEREDGRHLVLAVGGGRLRVRRWLRDDPYPLAEVDAWPDDDPPSGTAGEPGPAPDLQSRMDALVELVGEHVPDDERARLVDAARLPDDPDAAAWQAAVVADLGPLDAQRLLEAPGRVERLALLDRLLDERLEVLAFTLGLSGT